MILFRTPTPRSEEHTSELQSLRHLVCRLLLEKKNEPRVGRDGDAMASPRARGIGRARGSRSSRIVCALTPMGGRRVAPAISVCFFFFNDTAPTEIYTLSLHDALPIFPIPKAVVESFLSSPEYGFVASVYDE